MSPKILVPVDGSSESEKAVEHALSEVQGAEITLLHVVNPASSFSYGGDDYFDAEGYQEHVEQQREDGKALLEEYRETAAARGVDVETALETGKPARKILERIEEGDVDRVIMGSRGRSGVGRVLFGSVAETVTRRASVPVTIVR
jgi:nucleotide-binding universal stress UspA family protein